MVDTATTSVADLLKQHRAAVRFTQEELAERAGLSVRAISDLERGIKLHPYPHTIQKLVQALELDEQAAKRFVAAARRPQAGIGGLETAEIVRQDTSLPIQPTSFIGRQREVEEVKNLLGREQVRLLTLTGPGGVGKTRLALRTAQEMQDTFPAGVVFVSLASVSDPALVPATIATGLKMKEASRESLLDQMIEHLQERRLLLVLDNFEHLLPAAEGVSLFLSSCSQLTILVTSRAILHLAAEREYPLPPLPTPISGHLPELDRLGWYDAIQLFLQRAQAIKPGFELTEENAAAIAELCSRLDGLPLAIELAAARIRLFPPATLLARMTSPLQLLTGGPQDQPIRQRTLRQTIDWSYSLLTSDERRLLARLSIFAGGCTLEAAEAVCNPEGTLDVVAGTTALVEQSLLRPEEDGQLRLRMLETIREYALQRLEAAGQTRMVREQHARYFLGLAEEAERAVAERHEIERDRASWIARLEGDYDNLRAALTWSLEQESSGELAIRLVGALVWFWKERFDLSEGRGWIERALTLCTKSQSGGASGRARAQALTGVATLARRQGDHGAARAYAQQAVELWRGLGDPRGLAFAFRSLGQVATHQGDHTQAASLLTEAAEHFRTLGDVNETVRTLGCLADVEGRRGELAAAQSRVEEALALSEQAGNTGEILSSHCALAELAWIQGKQEAAHRHYDEATALLQTRQGARERYWALADLAWVAYHLGDYGEATARYAESLALVRVQPDAAARSRSIAWLLNHLGDMARCQGDDTRAAELYEESLALFRRQEERQGIAAVLHNLGHVDLAQQEPVRARVLFTQSLCLFRDLNFAWSIADCIAGLACVAAQEGSPDRAALLFGAAEAAHAALDASGTDIEPANRLTWEREMARARSQLHDEDRFARAWQQGRAMSLEQALALALEGMPAPNG